MARRVLADQANVEFHQASVANTGLPPSSQDFGNSLGVLHHVPDIAAAIRSCAELLKPGAPLLLYLYYAFDNRPRWFRLLWHLSNAARLLIRRQLPLLLGLVLLAAGLLFWPFPATLVFRLVLLLVLAMLIVLSSVRDLQFPGLPRLAWVGAISYSLYLIHNPLQSLVVSLALRLHQPESLAAALLVLIPLLAAVVYYRTLECWLLQLMHRAAARLQSS